MQWHWTTAWAITAALPTLWACAPPVACNPEYGGACPTGMVCDAQTEFCVSDGSNPEPESNCGFFGCFTPEPEPIGNLEDTYTGFSAPGELAVHNGRILVVDQGDDYGDDSKVVSLTPGGNKDNLAAGLGLLAGLAATGNTGYATDIESAEIYTFDLETPGSGRLFYQSDDWSDDLDGFALEAGYVFASFDGHVLRIDQNGDAVSASGSLSGSEYVAAGGGYVFFWRAGNILRIDADFTGDPGPVTIASPSGGLDRPWVMRGVTDDAGSGGGWLYIATKAGADGRGRLWRTGFDGGSELILVDGVGEELPADESPIAWDIAADTDGYAFLVRAASTWSTLPTEVFAARGTQAPVRLGTVESGHGIALTPDAVVVSERDQQDDEVGRIRVFSRP